MERITAKVSAAESYPVRVCWVLRQPHGSGSAECGPAASRAPADWIINGWLRKRAGSLTQPHKRGQCGPLSLSLSLSLSLHLSLYLSFSIYLSLSFSLSRSEYIAPRSRSCARSFSRPIALSLVPALSLTTFNLFYILEPLIISLNDAVGRTRNSMPN